MKLRSISLRYFRQHLSTSISFQDGLLGIIGTNGSGKTTILEGVGFALFGSRALRGRVEDVRSRGAAGVKKRGKNGSETSVELVIEHEGTVFRIVRTLTNAELFAGGEPKPIVQGNREVSSRISILIGMSYEEFVATYCTEQKGLEFLSGQKGATEREKFIMRMMGYDRLEDLQGFIRGDRKEKRAVLQGHEASSGSRDELVEQRKREDAVLIEIVAKHAEAKQVLAGAEADFASRHARMQRSEESRTLFLKEQEHARTLNVRIEEREKRLKVLDDGIERETRELATVAKSLVGVCDLLESVNDFKRELATSKARIEELRASIHDVELEWRDALSTYRARKSALLEQKSQVESKAERMSSLDEDGVCPTCQQSLSGGFAAAQSHLRGEIQEIGEAIASIDGLMQTLQVEPKDLLDLKASLAKQLEEVERLNTKIVELEKCQDYEKKIAVLKNERDEIAKDVQYARESVGKAKERLRDARFNEEEYAREKGAHDAAQRLVEVARLQRVRLEGEVNTQSALVARSTADIEKFDAREALVSSIRHELQVLDECDLIVTDFRKWVNTTVRPRMAELASEYLTDLTDGRYTAVELADDFTPTVMEDGEPKRVISGGEEDILNLCMRIALSHMLAERAGQRFSLLMLDEVFGSLDESRRSNVLALLEKLRQRFEQIIIITHLDDVKEGVQHLIQIDYDEAQGSAVVLSEDLSYDEVGVVNL